LKTVRILGFVFILVGGIIYSIERAVSIMSTSMIRAGFFAGSMTGEVPNVEASGLFSNPFVELSRKVQFENTLILKPRYLECYDKNAVEKPPHMK